MPDGFDGYLALPESHRLTREPDPDYTQYQKAPTFAVRCESLEHHTYRKGAPL